MSSALSDRLRRSRHDGFVGREEELALLRGALEGEHLPFHVAFVHGPGGIGKTSLLEEVAWVAAASGAAVARVDGEDVAPTPEAATPEAAGAALRTALEAAGQGRRVLLVDTYEALAPVDEWFRATFCASLDADVLVVVAGRAGPSVAWRSDPGWRDELAVLPLRNLAPDEAAAYLRAEGVEEDSREAALAFTHGHPLALALVAAHVRQRPGAPFKPAEAPDVVGALLERFVREEPDPTRRAALEGAALVRTTTEPLLGAMLQAVGASGGTHGAFGWLRGLHFAETEPAGLRLHDLAREVIAADLRWRDPDRYDALHAAARRFYTGRLLRPPPRTPIHHTLGDYAFLYRGNPLVRPFFAQLRGAWREAGHRAASALREGDRVALVAMTARHEGEASAAVLTHWLDRRPEAVEVFRSASGEPAGYLLTLRLGDAEAMDLEVDPGLAAASGAAGPLRGGEQAVVFRFWMDADAHQGVSAVQSLVFASTVRTYLTTPGLAVSLLCTSEPELWGPVLTFAGLRPAPEAAFETGGHAVSAFAHDWRAEPPEAWLDALAERVPQMGAPPAPRDPLVVLSQEAFGEAVREALRGYARPHRLRTSPLLQSRLVRAASAQGDEADRIDALRHLIADAASPLAAGPREAPYHRALVAAYLDPAPSQMLAAERIGVPFSTFRRHLGRAVEHVVAELWRRETSPSAA